MATLPKPQAASIKGIKDAQEWTYYDFQTYAAAGQATLTFFQNPVGFNGRTKEDTNFPGAGQLPSGLQFTLQEMQFEFYPGATVPVGAFGAQAAPLFVQDVYAVGSRGYVEFKYLSKNFVEDGPLSRFPTDVRLAGFGAFADATTAGAALQSRLNYAQWAGRPYKTKNIAINPNTGFTVTVSWPNGVVALPSTVAGRLACRMKGILRRDVQ